jgi:hypothetical protein
MLVTFIIYIDSSIIFVTNIKFGHLEEYVG